MAARDTGLPEGAHPLLRLLPLARPVRGRLVLAVLAAAAATGCGVALLGVSGFLLARASQHPSIDRKSTRLNSSHIQKSRMPSSA